MTFKEKIDGAIREQYNVHSEIVTTVYVANVLWADSPVGSRRSRMSQVMKDDIDLKASQIKIMQSIFPETNAQYWVD